MAATSNAQLIDIRTFGSIEEIRALDNFVESAPLSKTNYKRLLGDYHLTEEVRCCFQKDNGNLCSEGHKHGWVAEQQDGTATIIGGNCAKEKFGADSSLVADTHRFINEQRRRKQLATMVELLPLKDQRMMQLSQMRTSLIELDKRIKDITSELGPLVQRRLRDMVRTRHLDVVIDATKYREDVDAKGKTRQEKSTFAHVLGSLGGLDLTSSGTFIGIYDAINDFVRAYQRAEELQQDSEVTRKKSKEVDSVVSRMQQYDRIVQDGQRLFDLENVFLSNEFQLLCFLSSDRSERIKAAKIAIRCSRDMHYKGNPEGWLSAKDDAIKDQLQVDAISIR
jgi:hypothetical protein